jgi:hypothetical protein
VSGDRPCAASGLIASSALISGKNGIQPDLCTTREMARYLTKEYSSRVT